MKKIAVFHGDGIGKEVVSEALKVLKLVGEKYNSMFQFVESPIGGTAYDLCGLPFPKETLDIAKSSDAVLLGAVGGTKWDDLPFNLRPERALLGIRKELELYANLRPAKLFEPLVNASPLKMNIVEGTDILVIRELVGGIYFGEPRGIKDFGENEKRGFNTLSYTSSEIERIAITAFEVARKRKKRLTSVDKANVLESSGLWREVIQSVHKRYNDVELSHMYIDNCSMQLIRDPKQFDVIVTSNLFGDILSDESAMLTGSIGMLPSASIGKKYGMYEPVHGSAPDIAGKDIANPIAAILSVAMMLKYSFDMVDPALKIEDAVNKVLEKGYRTVDIDDGNAKNIVGTKEMGDLVSKYFSREEWV